MTSTNTKIELYLEEKVTIAQKFPVPEVARLVEAVWTTYEDDGSVYIFANGGPAGAAEGFGGSIAGHETRIVEALDQERKEIGVGGPAHCTVDGGPCEISGGLSLHHGLHQLDEVASRLSLLLEGSEEVHGFELLTCVARDQVAAMIGHRGATDQESGRQQEEENRGTRDFQEAGRIHGQPERRRAFRNRPRASKGK